MIHLVSNAVNVVTFVAPCVKASTYDVKFYKIVGDEEYEFTDLLDENVGISISYSSDHYDPSHYETGEVSETNDNCYDFVELTIDLTGIDITGGDYKVVLHDSATDETLTTKLGFVKTDSNIIDDVSEIYKHTVKA